MNKIIPFLLFFVCGIVYSQQLNCTVTVDSQRLNVTNQQVFKTLQTSLIEFVNKTDWTGQPMKQVEKINCSMYITILSNSADQFTASIQVQSSRPTFNSTYASPVFNFNDKDFNFRYTEFENLFFNPASFDSNLVSVVAFYSYLILGLDADTFVLEAGNTNLEIAQNICNVAQQSGTRGWSQADGNQNRFFLINDFLAPPFKQIRETMLDYHLGLDIMSQDLKLGKEKVKLALSGLSKLSGSRPNAFLTRVFFDAKSDEIVSIFSGGPSIPISDLVDGLNKTSPLNASKWSSIKF
ncbi:MULTISPECIES: DUF4835 family protein [unclassified Flavobacterium]|uniref:type IX secretion system protein PorD n=1 Tax=unclassified Flavobacterium TaxID=196869 RepID=UPI00131E1D2B|nr:MULTISPECIES: DUF4835 family protein [unclassified Flavobacterium]